MAPNPADGTNEPPIRAVLLPDALVTGTYPTVPDPDVLAGTRARERRGGDVGARRAAERRLAAVVEGMSEAFLSLDAAWRVTYANRAACILNGSTRATLIGRDHWATWPETVGCEIERQYRRVAADGVPARFEHHYPGADVWHAIQVYPAEGGGLAVFYRDVTADKIAAAERERLLADSERARADAERARADAERARAEAEAANRAKVDFLATMSHELRTPLNAIGGYAELLDMGIRGPVTEQQRQDLARIQASQRHLLGLINEVLNYAKIETGAVRYALADVLMAGALAAAEELVTPQAGAKGVMLTLRACAPDIVARADAEKLRQILVNLLSNAVKFTDRDGAIDLECCVADGRVHVTVRDTGIGIPASMVDAVFEPFVQVRSDLTRTTEGTGLGLPISRDLARGMGGDLAAESVLGVGSAFTLTLPAGGGDA